MGIGVGSEVCPVEYYILLFFDNGSNRFRNVFYMLGRCLINDTHFKYDTPPLHGIIIMKAGVGQVCIGKRSEEHTSELQSLMRISYAVFCLKNKNNLNTTHHRT